MDTKLVIDRIDAAKRDITAAEVELETTMRKIRAQTRAEKVTISTAVESAFVKLKRARQDLAELEAIVRDAD